MIDSIKSEERLIRSGVLRFIPILGNQQSYVDSNNVIQTISGKAPAMGSKSWSKEIIPADEQLSFNNRGLICGNHAGEGYISCIDIDGLSIKDGVNEVLSNKIKSEVCKHLYEIIVEEFKEQGVSFISEKSSTGYHIWLCVSEPSKDTHPFKGYALNDLSGFSPEVADAIQTAGKELGKGFIEIFFQNKYVIVPKSIVEGNVYQYLDDGVDDWQTLLDNQVINPVPIIEKALNKNLDKVNADIENIYSKSSIEALNNSESVLLESDIKNIAQIVIDGFVDGTKHTQSLALGGMLVSQKVPYVDAIKIVQIIADEAGNRMTDVKAFANTVLQHYSPEYDPGEGRSMTGFEHFWREQFSHVPYCKERVAWFTQGFIDIDDGNYGGRSRDIIRVNRQTCLITSRKMKYGKINDEDEGWYLFSEELIGRLVPTHITHRINCVNETDDDCFDDYEFLNKANDKMKASFRDINLLFETNFMKKNSIGPNFEKIIKNIINYFNIIGISECYECAPVNGLFLVENELRRWENHVEIPIENPKDEDFIEAWQFLCKYKDICSWDSDQFATLLKWMISAPFSFIFRHNYKKEARYLVLSGVGGTMKTSVSSSLLNIWGGIQVENSSADSEFMFATKLGDTALPCVFNEAERILADEEGNSFITILKSLTESTQARERKGNKQPGYCGCMFVTNTEVSNDPAFRRRSDIIEFTNAEIPSDDQIDKIAALMNYKGQRNYHAKKFKVIGDKIAFIVKTNHFLMDDTIQNLSLGVLEILKNEYPDLDFDWVIESSKEVLVDERIADSDLFDAFRKTLVWYVDNTKLGADMINGLSKIEKIKVLSHEGKIPFLYANSDGTGFIIASEVRNAFKHKEKHGPKIMSEIIQERYPESEIEYRNLKVKRGDKIWSKKGYVYPAEVIESIYYGGELISE